MFMTEKMSLYVRGAGVQSFLKVSSSQRHISRDNCGSCVRPGGTVKLMAILFTLERVHYTRQTSLNDVLVLRESSGYSPLYSSDKSE